MATVHACLANPKPNPNPKPKPNPNPNPNPNPDQVHAWLAEPWAEDGAPAELVLPATNPFLRRALFEEVEQLREARPELQAESRAVEGEADNRKKQVLGLRLSPNPGPSLSPSPSPGPNPSPHPNSTQVVVLRLSAAAQRARAEAAREQQLASLTERAGFLRMTHQAQTKERQAGPQAALVLLLTRLRLALDRRVARAVRLWQAAALLTRTRTRTPTPTLTLTLTKPQP